MRQVGRLTCQVVEAVADLLTSRPVANGHLLDATGEPVGLGARDTLRQQAQWIRQFPEIRFRVYGLAHKGTQCGPCPVKPGLECGDGDAENAGGLPGGQTFDITQQDDLAVTGIERRERLLEHLWERRRIAGV